MQTYVPGPALVPDVWFEYEIVVQGDDYTCSSQTRRPAGASGPRRFTTPMASGGRAPGFIGAQVYPGNTVAWRHIRIKP